MDRRYRSELEVRYIDLIMADILIENMKRGHHATGIASVNTYGGVRVLKDNVDAQQFTGTPQFLNLIHSISKNTTALLGHTRYMTQGSEKDMNNNHPIITDNIVGTHNGMIFNDVELFAEHYLERQAEVDSEVLFRMAEKCLSKKKGKKLRMEKYIDMIEGVEGNMTTVFMNKNDPNKVYIFKGDNPLSAYHNKRLGLMLYSSEEEAIVNVLADDVHEWLPVELDPMTAYIFHRSHLPTPSMFREINFDDPWPKVTYVPKKQPEADPYGYGDPLYNTYRKELKHNSFEQYFLDDDDYWRSYD